MASEEAKEFRGFGDKPAVPRAATKGQKRREAAATRYDEMAAAGMPEYSIWIRLKDPPRPPGMEEDEESPPMPWLPVGSLSVPRSSQVAQAIYESEEDLLQGAYRLYPNMKKEALDNLEYGYQLQEYPDEEVRLAEKPVEGFMGNLRNWFGELTTPLNIAK